MEDLLSRGPKAPKDPTKKRPALYVMLDDAIEGRVTPDGKYMEICFLEGRVAAKLTAICPELDREMADALQFSEGLRKMVHSIGISVIADQEEDRGLTAQFSLNVRQKENYNGTSYGCELSVNGEEKEIVLADYPEDDQDTSLASFRTFFPKYMTAKMTILFYMNDGYDVPTVTPDAPVDFDSPEYRAMIDRSLLHRGNVKRLKQAMERAAAGEDVTIAYIGGSITQGAGAKPIGTMSYAYQSYTMFKERYGAGDGSNVHFVKAGVGGTPSELGLTRYNMDLLRYGTVTPDVVIIEFAVNDAGDETGGVCYESLALKAYEGPGKPAVILLFSVFIDDYTLEDNLKRVGYHYDFPMVSLRSAVTSQFYEPEPVIKKRQYFYDLYHPTNDGHRVMADCIGRLFTAAEEAPMPEEDIVTEKEPVIGNRFRNLIAFTRKDASEMPEVLSIDEGSFTAKDTELQCVEMDDLPYASPEYPENWMHVGGQGTEPFVLNIRCKDLMIVYKDSGDHKVGKAKVFVDGREARILDPLEVGWVHCTALIVHQAEDSACHEVRVCPDPEDGSKDFTILGFGYTR